MWLEQRCRGIAAASAVSSRDFQPPQGTCACRTGTQGMAGTGGAPGSHLPLHCSPGQEQVPVMAQRLISGSATCLLICSGTSYLGSQKVETETEVLSGFHSGPSVGGSGEAASP